MTFPTERPDAMDYRFNPIDTCPRCDEPTEIELSYIAGETIATVVERANAILRKYGVEACMQWCCRCQKPTDHYADRSDSYRCVICE